MGKRLTWTGPPSLEEANRLEAEIERLTQENGRLREALEALACGVEDYALRDLPEGDYKDVLIARVTRAREAVREAPRGNA